MRPSFACGSKVAIKSGARKNATACSFPKAPTVAKRTYWWPCCFTLSNEPTLVFPCRILCHFFRKSMPPPAELLIPRENNLRKILAKRWPKKIKRAGPSHKPHPKATCPHPTRPLRPPGRRAPDDYAQVARKMQPKVDVFSDAFCGVKSRLEMKLLTSRSTRHLRAATPTQCYATR